MKLWAKASSEGAGGEFPKDLKILVADKAPASALSELRAQRHQVDYHPDLTSEELQGAIEDHEPDVLVVRATKVTKAALTAAPCLKLILRAGAGTDNIDRSSAKGAGVVVANCPGANADAVAELCWALILAADRNVIQQKEELKEGVWNKVTHANTMTHKGIKGRSIGILGFGMIGKEVARRAAAFGMQVLIWGRSYQETPGIVHIPELGIDVESCSSVGDVAERSDVISVHLPKAKGTDRLLDQSFFDRMQDNSIFVNTARGSVVDAKALLNAIESKGLKVGLDVYDDEPVLWTGTFDNELAKHPSTVSTQHVGAGTMQADDAISVKMLQVISEYASSGNVITPVD